MRIAVCILPSLETREKEDSILNLRAGGRYVAAYRIKAATKNFYHNPFPYHLACAASYITQNRSTEIVFHDSACLLESTQAFLKWLKAYEPTELITEISSYSYGNDQPLLRQIKELLPNCRICLCGPWINLQRRDKLTATGADAFVIGEYETGVEAFVAGASGFILSKPLNENELNAAPYPWMQEGLIRNYYNPYPEQPKGQQIQLFSSRGCLFGCTFCSWPASLHNYQIGGKNTVRFYKSPYIEGILRDIKLRFCARSVHFEDDCINISQDHLGELCAVMKGSGLGWTANCRIDLGSEADWQRMRDAGCYGIVVGLETGSQYVMDKILKKGVDLTLARERIEYIRGLGMSVSATFLKNIPGIPPELEIVTKEYAETVPANDVRFIEYVESDGAPMNRAAFTAAVDRKTLKKASKYVREPDYDSRGQILTAK